jgi:hypothetical protein
MKVICTIHSTSTEEVILETDITEEVDKNLALGRPAYSTSGFNGACYLAAIKTRTGFEDANGLEERTLSRIRIVM